MDLRMPSAVTASPSEGVISTLGTLLAFNTVSSQSNLPLIEYCQARLSPHASSIRLTHDAERRKANLFATLGAARPGGLILSAHTDTVPVDDQPWTLAPFAATLRDGRVYGRGSCDMKGFIACVLEAAPQLAQAQTPVHVALSYDEEVGCFGARELIADLRDAGLAPAACIIGEPTEMVPAIAHKGVYRYRCCVRGKEAHSSLTPHSVNAIEYAARVIARITGMAEEFEQHEPRWEGFDVPYTTASVGVIHGGIADNVVPRDCTFNFEFRNLPNRKGPDLMREVTGYARTLEPQMQRVSPEAGFRFETICEVPEFEGEVTSSVTRLAKLLSQQQKTSLVAFGTEAGLFSRAGIQTVVCGPGSIAQAHQPDEFVTLDQLAACERFMQALAAQQAITFTV
jgi:acetylornithine deacetylase